jgi:predicted Zn-dependent peptidase
MYGSHIERIFKQKTGKNVYGISHFIEHLGFRATKDFSTTELLKHLKNEGTYNASTDYDRINYWFQTTMDRMDMAVKLVCNYALNDLSKIPQEEFDIEKKVVYNEAKRYADDDQTMFYFDSGKALCNYEDEDNVIGIPETIDTFTLEDAQHIKDIFLQSGKNVINVTYDPNVMSEAAVILKIEEQMARFKPLGISDKVSQSEYDTAVIQPINHSKTIPNDSEQAMTILNLDVVSDKITSDSGNQFLSNYAEDVSLNDVIREQNGLTYGVSFGATNVSYKPYTYFACDVSRGTEQQLMELFNESINKSADLWGQESYEKYMKAKNLKRTMSLLDQKNYGAWHSTGTWYPEVIEALAPILAEDLDAGYTAMDNMYSTESKIGEYIEKVRKTVNDKDYGFITNY